MATKQASPADLMSRFSQPLWQRIRLKNTRPLWIVEGVFRGYNYTVIELEHDGAGLLSTDTSRDVTTVFTIKLPKKSDAWYLPDQGNSEDRLLCVDDGHVYAAALAKQPRVRDWTKWLTMATNAADQVIRGPVKRPVGQREKVQERVWNAQDRRWVLLWSIWMSPILLLVWALLLSDLQQWLMFGKIVHCDLKTQVATSVQGWSALLYLAPMLVPMIGAARLVYVMNVYIQRPGFALRLNLEGIVAAVCCGLALMFWQNYLDGHETSCEDARAFSRFDTEYAAYRMPGDTAKRWPYISGSTG